MRSRVRPVRGFVAICLMAAIFVSAAPASESVSSESSRRWHGKTIQLSLSRSLFRQSSAIKYGASVRESIEASATAWSGVARVAFRFVDSELESVSDFRSGGDGKSLITVAATADNIALFPKESNSPPAYTRLFFNRQGSIIEADVVLNPFFQFSTDGTQGTFDLQSVITHELGHVLGLGHSPAMGATMFGRMPQNRDDAPHTFPTRDLSESDISMIRAVYGPSVAEMHCCALVAGNTRETSLEVWAEDRSSGRVIAAETFRNGRYSIGGLPTGEYRILAQPTAAGGAVEVANLELEFPTRLRTFAFDRAPDVNMNLLGLNGELGSLPIRVTPGRTYQIFLGGTGLDTKSVSFGFSTSHISAVVGSVAAIDYGRGISAVVMTIVVDQDIAEGEYSVFVESAAGIRRYMIGALSVD